MRICLKDIAKVQIGYQLRGRLVSDAGGTHRIIQMRDVDGNGLFAVGALSRFTPSRDAERYVVAAGTVLFQARGRANVANVVPEVPGNTLASSHFFIVVPANGIVLSEYLAWYLNTGPVQSFLKSKVQGTTMMLVPRGVFDNIEIEVPPIEVQQKIVRLTVLRSGERRLAARLDARRDMLVEALCLKAAHHEESEETKQ